MKKIAIVSKTFGNGGVEKALVNMLKNIDYSIYQIDLYTPTVVLGVYPAQVKLIKMKTLIGNTEGRYFLLHPLQTIRASYVMFCNWINRNRSYEKQIIQNVWTYQKIKEKYDLAIAYDGPLGYSIFYTLSNIQAKKKYFWIHGSVKGDHVSNRVIEKYYSKYDKLVFVSESIKKEFDLLYPKMKEKTIFFYNFIDENVIYSKSKEMSKLKRLTGEIAITTVARLSYEKGIDIAIMAARLLRNKGLKFQWNIIGDGIQREKLEKQISDLKLQGIVHMLGEKDNPYPYIKYCDIYVQPSRTEGYCTTTREAKILCKPVIAFDVGGMREQFIDGQNGYLVKREDCEALVQTIYQLAIDKQKREKIEDFLRKEYIANDKQGLYTLLDE